MIQGHSDKKMLQKQDLPLGWQDKAIIELLYGGKNKVEMNVIKISDMHAASLSLKQLVLVHSGN